MNPVDVEEAFVRAGNRLVPWLKGSSLRDHVSRHPAQDEDLSAAVAIRSVDVGEAEIWVDMVFAHLNNRSVVEAARNGMSNLEDQVKAALESPLVTTLARILAAPIERREYILTKTASESQILEGTTEEGTTIRVDVGRVGIVADSLPIGARLRVTGFEDARGELVVTHIYETSSDTLLDRATPEPEYKSASEKTAALKIFSEWLSADRPSPAGWTVLLQVEVLPAALAREIVALLESHFPTDAIPPPAFTSALLGRDGIGAASDLHLRLLLQALRLPERALGSMSLKLAEALSSALTDAREDTADEIRRALARRRSELEQTDFTSALIAASNDADPAHARAWIRYLIAPVAAKEALDLTVQGANAAVDAITATDEETSGSDALAWLELFRALGMDDPATAAEAVLRLRYSRHAPETATVLMELLDLTSTLNRPLSPIFVETSTRGSRTAALAGLKHAAIQAPLKIEVLRAVLTSVGRYLAEDATLHPEIISALKKNQRRMPLAHQLGILAAESSPTVAERIAKTANLRGGLEQRVFTLARQALARDIELATERYRLAELWKTTDKTGREIASKAYAEAFQSVTTGPQLSVVLESALRFFPGPKSIPDVGALREAGLDALARIPNDPPNPALTELFETATEQLRWNVSRKAPLLRRVRRRFGL